MSIQMLTDDELDAVSGGDSVHITNDIDVSNSSNVGIGVANAVGNGATANATGVGSFKVNFPNHHKYK